MKNNLPTKEEILKAINSNMKNLNKKETENPSNDLPSFVTATAKKPKGKKGWSGLN